jgi:hypothetical protein
MPKTLISYEKTLRAIGQGLETLRVEKIELEACDDHYLVQGYGSRPQPSDAPKPSFIKQSLHFLTRSSKNTAGNRTTAKKSPSFEFAGLQISQKDIDDFDRRAKLALPTAQDNLNPQSVSQILRLVGAYLDYRKSSLLKLSWRNQTVTLWRRDGLGVESKEIFTPTNLYDLWVHRYKQRRSAHAAPAMKKTGSD